MFEDEKIRLIEQMPDADTILVIWVKLLAQAGKTNASGYIYLSQNIPYTEEMLATIFNRPVNTVRLALKTFEDFGMIEIDDDQFIAISNWERHQNIEGMERVKKLNAERNRRYRERKKQQQIESENKHGDVSVTPRDGTELELELEEELELDKEKDSTTNCIRNLFNHYLSKNIIKHQKITGAMRSATNARLRDYSFEQLKQAIDNYATVYQGQEYWFNTKYGFADLMRDKDVRKFINDADPLNNFKRNDFGAKKSNGTFDYDPAVDSF